jgi:hypothetical protein
MSTQPRGDLKFTARTSVSRNAMNPFGCLDELASVEGFTVASRRARDRQNASIVGLQRSRGATDDSDVRRDRQALAGRRCLLRDPVNLDELNALIGEVLKRPRRSRLAHLTGAKLGHNGPNPEVVC